ncbi:threonine aldolase family protein [Aurantiacibacter spongiae]|uniref:Low specificity L-threonine aldolase n=1 Tax=Aurantiacibacter spongiae TaxID=2488860 RepID=A0A3N5D9K9_9SPHN|nr:beta-eliminating lyase-related protein [Aurantiacibacter spongiae]RPF71318.1 low specificity L-threonine aldolase [Aurantiacibacter spongiae]
MQFLSDNAAPVHPQVWRALQAADDGDTPYDTDALSREMDARFSALFGRECAALWVATGTAANCLALATMVEPHGGVICHEESHIEQDECGAPGFYLHGAKLMLAPGEGAKLSPEAIEMRLKGITRGVHQVPAQAISITQSTEYGVVYRPRELAAIGALAGAHGLGLHMDGARFANAAAFLGGEPSEAVGPADVLSFGFVKNGGMGAEAVVFFDPGKAEVARWRRKRAGHLQSKGRFLAAQILALLEDDLWLRNARAANAAAQEVAGGATDRLLCPVEANELFVRADAAERAALREAGFAFYDWNDSTIRVVTSWATDPAHAAAFGKAIARL